MNDQKRESVMRKIRACLARADAERNDSEQERAIALRQANALMDQYGIEAVELGETDEMGERGEGALPTGSSVWRYGVISALAPLYGCQCYRTQGRGGETFVVGRAHYRNVVVDMALYVIASIERESGMGYNCTEGGGRRYKNAFRKGAALGIREQVEEIIAARKRSETVSSTSKAMVLVDHYASELVANDEWIEKNIGKLGTFKSTYSSGAGYADGKAYGKSVGLNDQIGGGSGNSSPRRLR